MLNLTKGLELGRALRRKSETKEQEAMARRKIVDNENIHKLYCHQILLGGSKTYGGVMYQAQKYMYSICIEKSEHNKSLGENI